MVFGASRWGQDQSWCTELRRQNFVATAILLWNALDSRKSDSFFSRSIQLDIWIQYFGLKINFNVPHYDVFLVCMPQLLVMSGPEVVGQQRLKTINTEFVHVLYGIRYSWSNLRTKPVGYQFSKQAIMNNSQNPANYNNYSSQITQNLLFARQLRKGRNVASLRKPSGFTITAQKTGSESSRSRSGRFCSYAQWFRSWHLYICSLFLLGNFETAGDHEDPQNNKIFFSWQQLLRCLQVDQEAVSRFYFFRVEIPLWVCD